MPVKPSGSGLFFMERLLIIDSILVTDYRLYVQYVQIFLFLPDSRLYVYSSVS